MQQLAELTASARRLALVGLAKNTGKTETLAAPGRELQTRRDVASASPKGVTARSAT